MSTRCLLGALPAVLAVCLCSFGAWAGPKVVASIAPVHGLVSAVMDGVGEAELLIPPGQSPHQAHLRPSDARKLSEADVVFWIGPTLEEGLARPIEQLASDKGVSLLATEDLHLLPYRQWDGGTMHENHEHDHGSHETEGAAPDPHIWLNPDNARLMLAAIAEKLSHLDPQQAQTYRRNADHYAGEIQREALAIKAALEAHPPLRAYAYHDGYQYFEAYFSIAIAGVVSGQTGAGHSLKSLRQLRQAFSADGPDLCFLSEPQFPPGILEKLQAEAGGKIVTLDPLGLDAPRGAGHYLHLMHAMAESFRACGG